MRSAKVKENGAQERKLHYSTPPLRPRRSPSSCGCLSRADGLAEETKHPVILPRKCHVTNVIIQQLHAYHT